MKKNNRGSEDNLERENEGSRVITVLPGSTGDARVVADEALLSDMLEDFVRNGLYHYG